MAAMTMMPEQFPVNNFSSPCLRKDHSQSQSAYTKATTAASSSHEKPSEKPTAEKEAKNTVDSGLVSTMSTMKEAVCCMGIPEHIVDLAINTHGSVFSSVMDLLTAADKLLLNAELRQSSELEETAKAIVPDKEACLPSKDNCSISEAPASPSAVMLKAAEVAQVSADKSGLREKVRKLAKENHRLKLRKTCRMCKTTELASSGVTFLPCGHFITCEECSEKCDDCPACGKSIMGTVRTFLS